MSRLGKGGGGVECRVAVMIRVRRTHFLLLCRNTLSSHRNVSMFSQRMHNLTKKQFRK